MHAGETLGPGLLLQILKDPELNRSDLFVGERFRNADIFSTFLFSRFLRLLVTNPSTTLATAYIATKKHKNRKKLNRLHLAFA